MTAAAARILEEFETLDPQEQVIVRNQLVDVTKRRQLDALERLTGSSKGRDLVGKLLEERKRDKERE